MGVHKVPQMMTSLDSLGRCRYRRTLQVASANSLFDHHLAHRREAYPPQSGLPSRCDHRSEVDRLNYGCDECQDNHAVVLGNMQ
jgi:hypothetical protein